MSADFVTLLNPILKAETPVFLVANPEQQSEWDVISETASVLRNAHLPYAILMPFGQMDNVLHYQALAQGRNGVLLVEEKRQRSNINDPLTATLRVLIDMYRQVWSCVIDAPQLHMLQGIGRITFADYEAVGDDRIKKLFAELTDKFSESDGIRSVLVQLRSSGANALRLSEQYALQKALENHFGLPSSEVGLLVTRDETLLDSLKLTLLGRSPSTH